MAGFTIAEVLIAMGILGVIAALTIPMMLQSAQNRELGSQYLKVHNTLTNAYKETEAVEGLKLYQLTPSQFKTAFESHLKVIDRQNCGTGMEVCLADGSGLKYECDSEGATAGDQAQAQSETQTSTPTCHKIVVDTNGKKKPDADGKDRYEFLITDRGLVSEGENDYCEGLNCGNYVMAHHKLFDGIVEGCATYADGKCSACQDGYDKSGNSCNKVNLAGCSEYTGVACKTCGAGYIKNGGACDTLTKANCDSTLDGETCKTCKSGYYANADGKCSTQNLANCQTYVANENKCSVCSDTYYNKDNEGACKPINIDKCKTADENGQCRSCDDGYLVGKSNKCAEGKMFDDLPAYKMGPYYVTDGGMVTNPITGDNGNLDWFATAEQYCSTRGMHLPSYAELDDIYANYKTANFTEEEWVWVSDTDPRGGGSTFNTKNGVHTDDSKSVCYFVSGGYKYGCTPQDLVNNPATNHSVTCVK